MRTPETCPYRETEPPAPDPEHPRRWCVVRCGMLTGLAGFRISARYDAQCPRCVKYEPADNPYTRGFVKNALGFRVRCGDDPGYVWHNPASTPDAAAQMLIRDYDHTHEDIVDSLAVAVSKGKLTAERADEIAMATEAIETVK